MDFCLQHFCCGSRHVFSMFLNILILINIDDFAKGIAHSLSQIFPILEHLLFSGYKAFLERIFALNNSLAALEMFFLCFLTF